MEDLPDDKDELHLLSTKGRQTETGATADRTLTMLETGYEEDRQRSRSPAAQGGRGPRRSL
jgi:hypothetical protein